MPRRERDAVHCCFKFVSPQPFQKYDHSVVDGRAPFASLGQMFDRAPLFVCLEGGQPWARQTSVPGLCVTARSINSGMPQRTRERRELHSATSHLRAPMKCITRILQNYLCAATCRKRVMFGRPLASRAFTDTRISSSSWHSSPVGSAHTSFSRNTLAVPPVRDTTSSGRSRRTVKR